MTIVKTEKLTKSYGSGETEVKAVDAVDLEIRKGEFISIVGQSGSGKSTLLHLIGGVDRPTSGKVYIEGDDMYAGNESELAVLRRRKIGFIFQFFNLLPILTAEENIVLPLLMDKKQIDTDFLEEILDMLRLGSRRQHLPSELSGGQQQRVSIARALITRPSIILADEPTGNLDSENSRDVMDLLKMSAGRFGQTLLLVTHDHDLACEAERVINVEDGRIARDRVIR